MEPFKQGKEAQIEADEILKSIENTLNKKKKPVKFTWKGFADLTSSFLETNPFDKLKLKRIKELQEGSEAKEKDYIDFFEDIEKGLYGGVQDLGYGIGDLITSGIDAVADTNLSERLDEVYENNKIKDPETLTGEITKVLTQYGVPGGAAFKVLNRFKIFQRSRKLADTGTKLQKVSQIAKRAGYMSAALAATDFVASTPDKETFFVEEEKTDGLQGRDLALARLRNRVRFGAEGALLGGGFSLMGKPVALGFKYGIFKPGAKVAGIGLKAVDKAVVTPITYLGSKAITPAVADPGMFATKYVAGLMANKSTPCSARPAGFIIPYFAPRVATFARGLPIKAKPAPTTAPSVPNLILFLSLASARSLPSSPSSFSFSSTRFSLLGFATIKSVAPKAVAI